MTSDNPSRQEFFLPKPVPTKEGLQLRGLHWEVGSEFHLCERPSPPFLSWPEPSVWFSLGRQAVTAVLQHIGPKARLRLWVPTYFCHEVTEHWQGHAEVVEYADDPRWQEPQWQSLSPTPTDVVLAVNYFGVRDGTSWRTWRDRNKCVLLEDHSHDPAGPWARHSTADYAFSSLRKTLPVPDGAILWSPRGLLLPSQSTEENWVGVGMKLSAMILKLEFLKGSGDAECKTSFRRLQREGERLLEMQSACAISLFSREYLAGGIPTAWRERRASNVIGLLKRLAGWHAARPLFSKWPENSTPLSAVFLFPCGAERDRYRWLLESNNIYCPVHWPTSVQAKPQVRDLSARILTIPSDQRYSMKDMKRIAQVVLSGDGSMMPRNSEFRLKDYPLGHWRSTG
jgi:hypothetical protein